MNFVRAGFIKVSAYPEKTAQRPISASVEVLRQNLLFPRFGEPDRAKRDFFIAKTEAEILVDQKGDLVEERITSPKGDFRFLGGVAV